MKIPRSVLTAVAALLVASISCAQQDPIEATGNSNNVDDASVEPTVGDPVGFINAGQGRFISITGSEYEAIQRGERPETMNKFGEKLEPEDNAVGTAVVLSEDEKQSILDAHNSVRALHDSPPVTWNDEIAKFGDDYLQPCNFKHSGGKYGENLAYGYRNFTVAVRAWYDEVVKYDFDNPGFRKGTGHFTQVVWKGTNTIGCARRDNCPKYRSIYICEYLPRGNIVNKNNSRFRENVLPRNTTLNK